MHFISLDGKRDGWEDYESLLKDANDFHASGDRRAIR